MGTVRLRLVLDHTLTESQKTEGLKRCWILLKPQHKTISDLSSYLLHIFNLHNACPRGLLLSMDGFVLPPFESTSILKDNDIIRVKKKGCTSSEIVKIGDVANSLEVVEIVDIQPPISTGMNLLANEEFERESGGYKTKPEECNNQPEPIEDALREDSTPELKTVSKKRKTSKELQSSSKRKKMKSARTEKCAIVSEDVGNNVCEEQNGALNTAKVDEKRTKNGKVSPNAKSAMQPQENGNGNVDASHTPCENNKLPSRSARRKKAKRKWLREQLKAEKKERQLLERTNQQAPEKDNHKVSEQGNHKVSEEIPEKDNNRIKEDQQQPDQDSDAEDDIVPVVIRPGYIRYKPLSKVGVDESAQQNQFPVENFQWHGITSKKKGQKWGKEKAAPCRRNDYQNFNQECSKMLTTEEEKPIYDGIDFDKLALYCCLPKEGDIIAYRLIELSSSWTPEVSSYRVGKISQYDPESNRIKLVPVPEFPFIPRDKLHDEASAALLETSYGEDGSLEIDFVSLIEVRVVNYSKLNSAKSVANGLNKVHASDEDAGADFSPKTNNEAHTSAQEHGEVSPWEGINQALNSKKAELSRGDNLNGSEGTGRNPWSFKALRGTALGPTMALLRAQNGL